MFGSFLAGRAFAAEPVVVHPAQIAGPFGSDSGKLVVVGNQMVFVDDVNPANSFALSRSDIAGLDSVNGVVTFNMREPYALPIGSGSTLVLRLADPNGAGAVSSWAGMSPAMVGSANRVAVGQPSAAGYEFNVRHNDEDGRLVVEASDLHFESFKHREHSRTWAYAEIKEFKRDGNEIKIEPYRGDSFKFQIEGGRPMTEEIYNLIGDRIVAARRR
jgi:hypothetical protein